MRELKYFPEPLLHFKHGEKVEDPRDGLTLFGPLDELKPAGIRSAVIGTKAGIERFARWHASLSLPVYGTKRSEARPFFPGFETVFRTKWQLDSHLFFEIDEHRLLNAIRLDDKHQRVYEAVNIYLERILKARREEEVNPDVWCIVIPDEVRKYCRPRSFVEQVQRVKAESRLDPAYAKSLQLEPSLFADENELAKAYHYEVNFRNQLKARLLELGSPIQVVRESTIAPLDFVDRFGQPTRDLLPMLSDVAWHLSTAVFYKSGGRPWKIAGVRPGVCYIGIVFKQDERSQDPRTACCAAQMFLDSGDGVVFKGDVGPWFSPKRGDFHLSRQAAQALVAQAIGAYVERVKDYPRELFLHARTRFDDDEWRGFSEAVSDSTNLVGIRIKDLHDLRLYTWHDRAILRGLAHYVDDRSAYLWTRGLIPRLRTYPGREVPKPLEILVTHGNCSLDVVLADVLALTKLNYNACRLADGFPVTLKFANAVGEILTAGPVSHTPPLPFKYYI